MIVERVETEGILVLFYSWILEKFKHHMHFEQCSMHHEFKREIVKSHLTLPLYK